MIGGCLVVLVVGLKDVGGWSGLVEKLQRSPRHLELIVGVDAPSPFPWPAIVFGLAMVLSPAYWIGNQAIIQRSLGARSEYEAKASYVWGAMLKSIIPLIIAVPGLIAAVRYTDLSEGDAAFPRLVADLLPGGLRSVFIAGFLAALMSSVDSYLNSAATILCHDLYKRFLRPAATEADLLRVGRITTVLLIFVGIGCALVFRRGSEGVYAIFQTLMSFFKGTALAVLLSGIFWRRATGTGVLVGFVCGVVTSVALFMLTQPWVLDSLNWNPLFQIPQPFLYFSVWAFLVAFSVSTIVSLITPREPDEKLQYVFQWSNRRP
jgi:SSS family solute:Na+ symporter